MTQLITTENQTAKNIMNTTYDIFSTSLLVEHSSAPTAETIETESAESAPQTAPHTAKAAFPWEKTGVVLVLIIAMTIVGLWSWTLVEFLRYFVENMPQPNGLEIVLQ